MADGLMALRINGAFGPGPLLNERPGDTHTVAVAVAGQAGTRLGLRDEAPAGFARAFQCGEIYASVSTSKSRNRWPAQRD